jgi:hypothetical protein
MNRTAVSIVAGVIAFIAWSALMGFAGWSWRGDRADLANANGQVVAANAEAAQAHELRQVDRQQVVATQGAGNAADAREEKINADFQERLSAAVAGRDSDLGRLRGLWAGCETQRLADGAAASAEATEQDGLRRASAARVLRAVELAQSERDEAVDRYQAVEAAINKGGAEVRAPEVDQ